MRTRELVSRPTNFLTLLCRILLGKLAVADQSRNLPYSCATRSRITCFQKPTTRPILSHMGSVHTIPSDSFIVHFIIILPSYLCLPNRLFPSGYCTKTLCEFLFSPIRVVAPTHHILPDLVTLIIFYLGVLFIKFLTLYFSPPFRYLWAG